MRAPHNRGALYSQVSLQKQNLEKQHSERLHERDVARASCEQLEAETAEAKKQLSRLKAKLAQEEKVLQEAKASAPMAPGRISASDATSNDPEALARVLELLRRRNVWLCKSNTKCSDPEAPHREERSLALQLQELARLQQLQRGKELELRQRVRQVMSEQSKLEKREALSASKIDKAKDLEAYIKRLREADERQRELTEKRKASVVELEAEWQRWLGVLMSCARELESRADSGQEGAPRFEEKHASPAVGVLEVVRKLEARCCRLEKKGDISAQKEKELQKRLEGLHLKVDSNRTRIQAGGAGGSGLDARWAPADGASSAKPRSTISLPMVRGRGG